jgi:tetratricopeptide (TPR) repeat protein
VINSENTTLMSMLSRFCQRAALCGGILLLSFTLSAHADEIQDANQLFKQKQYDQALKKVDGVLASKPKDAQARFLKGLILTEQGKTDEAIKIFSALTEDYPELPEPYNNLAVLYAGRGEYEKARIALEMAIRTHPSYATAHENLGDIYAKMASQAYDRALQLDRTNTSTKTKLALIKELFSDDRNRAEAVANAGKPQQSAAESPAPVVAAASAPAAAPVPAQQSAATEPTPAKVAEAAKPAAEPAPAKPVAAPAAPAKAAANSSADVLKAVHGWAAAWSAQNAKQYLAFYAADFKTPGHESRSAWEAERLKRLTQPKFIHVKVSDASVKFTDNTHATVTFREDYRASHLQASTIKTLGMVESGGEWLIQEEQSRD